MKKSLFFAVILMMVTLTACSSGPSIDEVAAYGDPKVESMLQGYNEDDFALFSRDFGPMMKAALNEKLFDTVIKVQVKEVIGEYQTKKLVKITEKTNEGKNYVVAIYRAKFSKEEGDVAITVWFTDDELKNIETVLFSSPRLIEANG
ncbi:MAG: DUF3887 domain-containing protein [Eubacteriaceae bacterium]|nr:DUF3887 domain-containing protein [Eubacteriaceae bacterium]